ncbi:tachylectin-2-like [Orbicella faveolata]|uniref:tachylectin-2-like n=1 Tax=Orbicella faveolata TaxID=48498 RepID=UPI0009E48C77|nr:tachylectin-2-like [Orbicella faveolata]
MSFQDLFGAKHGAEGGVLYHRIPFESYTDDWQNSMIEIGDSGWDEFFFLFFHPDGDLCVVPPNERQYAGQLVKATPLSSPITQAQDWLANATLVAPCNSDFWRAFDVFDFLFFDPEGKLYGVEGNKFYSGPLQSSTQKQWLDSAKLLGTSGWSSFDFLFFDPEGILYGLKNGQLHKRSPPTDPTDDWFGTSELICTTGWRGFWFLFFMSNGELYVVTEEGENLDKESLYKGLPPTQGMPFDK